MMKNAGIVVLLIGFSMAGCGKSPPEDNTGTGGTDNSFVPVTNIIDVNTSVLVGTVSLGGKVVPSDATNKTIKWTVLPLDDDDEDEDYIEDATISGTNLTTTSEGYVDVRATIINGKAVGVNYTKDFTIYVDPFVPVSYIVYDGPSSEEVGDIYLDATVYPDDASYTDIIWSIRNAGTTKASIVDDVLTTRAPGTVRVTATIKNGKADGVNYTQDFSITIVEELEDEDED